MFLDSALKSLEVLLDGVVTANELTWAASYMDIDQTTFGASGALEDDGLTNGVTPVTVVPAPGASQTRQIKYLSIFNGDTAPAIVTLRINNNGVFRTIFKATLAVGDTVYYA